MSESRENRDKIKNRLQESPQLIRQKIPIVPTVSIHATYFIENHKKKS